MSDQFDRSVPAPRLNPIRDLSSWLNSVLKHSIVHCVSWCCRLASVSTSQRSLVNRSPRQLCRKRSAVETGTERLDSCMHGCSASLPWRHSRRRATTTRQMESMRRDESINFLAGLSRCHSYYSMSFTGSSTRGPATHTTSANEVTFTYYSAANPIHNCLADCRLATNRKLIGNYYRPSNLSIGAIAKLI